MAVYKDIDLSLTVHPITGDINTDTDLNAINNSLKKLLSTPVYSIPFNRLKGIDLRKVLFEQNTAILRHELKDAIWYVVENFEPRITPKEIEVEGRDENITITLYYTVKKTGADGKFKATIDRNR